MADELDALRRITQRRTRAEREWRDEIRRLFTAGHSIDQIAAAAGVRYEVGWSPKGGRSFGGPLRSVGLHPRGAGLGFRPSRHHAGAGPDHYGLAPDMPSFDGVIVTVDSVPVPLPRGICPRLRAAAQAR